MHLLSSEELDRLADASALKARQREAYKRRFMLAMGGLFEDLPAGAYAWATVNNYAIVLRQPGTAMMRFPVSFPMRDRRTGPEAGEMSN